MDQTKLFGGCYRSEFSVHPKDWDSAKLSASQKKAMMSHEWYIHYRFYDPAVRYESGPNKGKIKPKLMPVKGMNKFKTFDERRDTTAKLIAMEKHELEVLGFNPITREYMAPVDIETNPEIDPTTPFVEALESCHKLLDLEKTTKDDIASNLRYIKVAAEQLRYQYLPIKDVRRKHIYALLKRLAVIKPKMDIIVTNKQGEKRVIGKGKWTANTFNQYRKNLSTLFEELIELEATEVNATHGIKKKRHAVQKKDVLSPDEERRVDEFAYEYDTRFWILIHVFHHAGARTTEIFKVQGEHVNLKKKVVKYLVKKGRNHEWVERPIVDEAVPFWEMAMAGCKAKDYVFSIGLTPGAKPISPRQAAKRWERHIKGKLGIHVGWYELKHLNTTRNVEKVFAQIKEAQLEVAKLTGHKSEKMIASVYDINHMKRTQKELKEQSRRFG